MALTTSSPDAALALPSNGIHAEEVLKAVSILLSKKNKCAFLLAYSSLCFHLLTLSVELQRLATVAVASDVTWLTPNIFIRLIFARLALSLTLIVLGTIKGEHECTHG